MKRLLNRIPNWLKNKYLLTGVAFATVMLFLDRNDLFTQMDRASDLSDQQTTIKFYKTEIARLKKEANDLKTHPESLERFARENYLMKRDDEDLFLIPEKKAAQDPQ